MAVVRDGSTIIVNADGDTIAGNVRIHSITYVPGTGGPAATIKGKSGNVIWTAGGSAARITDSDIQIREAELLTINMTGTGTTLYLYLV